MFSLVKRNPFEFPAVFKLSNRFVPNLFGWDWNFGTEWVENPTQFLEKEDRFEISLPYPKDCVRISAKENSLSIYCEQKTENSESTFRFETTFPKNSKPLELSATEQDGKVVICLPKEVIEEKPIENERIIEIQ